MSRTSKITALDDLNGESNSITNQDVICRGWFLPPNTIT